jgi:uncharacterized protein YqfA (UPF0365 family)
MNPIVIIAIVAFVVVVGLAFLAFLMNYAKLYLQCRMSGVSIGIADLIGMTFRKVPPHVIVRAMIMAKEAGLLDGGPVGDVDMTSDSLEAHHLSGGHVYQVIRALVAANKAKTIKLTFREATAIDLAGRDVLESVQTSVYPKVIDCPAKGSGKASLDAVAKDGVQLKVRARVTVRANLQQLIGGAGEETIVARVGEGIVSAIGSADTPTCSKTPT